MKKLVVIFACACGGSAAPVVVIPSAAATANATPASPREAQARPHALEGIWSANYHGNVRGMAFHSSRLYVNVEGKLHVFQRDGDVAPTPHAWKAGEPLVVVGDALFDPVSFADETPKTAQGCEGLAFSADGARMSASCTDAAGNDAVHVYDARTGAEIAKLDEFHTAAPIRAGAITASGNFVFWSSRASGAFEEIRSHVVGPVMSSHSEMSPTEDMLFTTPDKNWMTEDQTPARMINPKNGRTLFELGNDVTRVRFSPSGRFFAALHWSVWKDMDQARVPGDTWFTIHAGDAASFGRSECNDADDAAFSSDDALVAIRCSSTIEVHAIR